MGEQLLGFDRVGLGDCCHLGSAADLGSFGGDPPVPRPDRFVGWQGHDDDIDVCERSTNLIVQSLPQQGSRLVKPWRVNKYQLTVGAMNYASNYMAGRLRLTRRDGDLLACEGVDQRRLAGIGTANHRYQPRRVGHRLILGALTPSLDGMVTRRRALQKLRLPSYACCDSEELSTG